MTTGSLIMERSHGAWEFSRNSPISAACARAPAANCRRGYGWLSRAADAYLGNIQKRCAGKVVWL